LEVQVETLKGTIGKLEREKLQEIERVTLKIRS